MKATIEIENTNSMNIPIDLQGVDSADIRL